MLVSLVGGGEGSLTTGQCSELGTQTRGREGGAAGGGLQMGLWLVAIDQWLSADLGKKASESTWAIKVEPSLSRPANSSTRGNSG